LPSLSRIRHCSGAWRKQRWDKPRWAWEAEVTGNGRVTRACTNGTIELMAHWPQHTQ
jgi:hypothetical protein